MVALLSHLESWQIFVIIMTAIICIFAFVIFGKFSIKWGDKSFTTLLKNENNTI